MRLERCSSSGRRLNPIQRRLFVASTICLLGCMSAIGQSAGPVAQAPSVETISPDIPGVVAGGTRVQIIKEGLQGAQGATIAPDGSLLFTERNLNRINRVDKDGIISSYMEDTSTANSFSFDFKGRAIA